MDQVSGMNSIPPAPIFGVASGGSGADAVGNGISSKYINIDEIFADWEGDGSEILEMGGAGNSTAGSLALGTRTTGGSGGVGAGGPGDGSLQSASGGITGSESLHGARVMSASSAAGDQASALNPTPLQTDFGSAAAGQGMVQAQELPGSQMVNISPFLDSGNSMAPALAADQRTLSGMSRGASLLGDRSRTTGSGAASFIGSAANEHEGAGFGMRSASAAGLDNDDEEDERAVGKRRPGSGTKRPRQGGRNMTEQQRLERRERNREHAKRSRVRKKFLLESLQKSVTALQEENEKLRGAIRSNLGAEEAQELLAQTEASTLIASNPGDATKVLDDPDYSLVKALQTAQQNFVITDPTLPDNPIVFASQGFLELTGYTLDQVLGRNCRFLQGPDTDPKAVEKIRKAIENGLDTSVCLRNYRVDGAMFWNQFFIAALRDSEGTVINYVGVQCKVNEDFVRAVQKREGEDEDGDEDEDEDEERSDAEDKDTAG